MTKFFRIASVLSLVAALLMLREILVGERIPFVITAYFFASPVATYLCGVTLPTYFERKNEHRHAAISRNIAFAFLGSLLLLLLLPFNMIMFSGMGG